jgi:hypothetical protein
VGRWRCATSSATAFTIHSILSLQPVRPARQRANLLQLVADERRPDDPASGPARDVSAGGSTVIEVAGSHAVYVSQPAAVADLIQTAANATTPAAIGA